MMGLIPFQLLVNDSRFRKCPMILETPKEENDNDRMDEINLAVLRGLMAEVS
jgi:endonuclease IV